MSIEDLYAPTSYEELLTTANRSAENGLILKKAGVVVGVFDPEGNMLVLEHKESAGNYPQGSLGASMETFRFIADRPDVVESPVEAWQRSLSEELPTTSPSDADISLGPESKIYRNVWVTIKGLVGLLAVSFTVTVNDPDKLVSRIESKEILSSKFMPPDEIISNTALVLRPGFRNWVQMMSDAPKNGPANKDPVEWVDRLPGIGCDVLFDCQQGRVS